MATNGDSERGTHFALPELLTTAEVARLFRRSTRTIRNWVRDGRLIPIQVGRSVYFSDAEISRVLGISSDE